MHWQQPSVNNLYDIVGGDGQPSDGNKTTGLRAGAVNDYQTGMCNVKYLYHLRMRMLCMLRIFLS